MSNIVSIPTYVTSEVHGRSVREALGVLVPTPEAATPGEVFAIEERGRISECALFTAGYTYWRRGKNGDAVVRFSDLQQKEKVLVGPCVAFLDDDWEQLEVFPSCVLHEFDEMNGPYVRVTFPQFVFFAALEDDVYSRPSPMRTDVPVPGFVLLAEGHEGALTPSHVRFLEQHFGVSPQGPALYAKC